MTHAAASESQVIGRQTIANLEMERKLLANLLHRNEYVDDVALIISEDVFFYEGHKLIFRTLLEKRRKGEEFDITLLGHTLNKIEPLGIDRWDTILLEIVDHAWHGEYSIFYARELKEAWTRRLLEEAGGELQIACHRNPDLQAVINEHVETVARLTESGQGNDPLDCTAGIAKFMESLESKDSKRIPTGYYDLDRYLRGGFETGRQYGIGAPTSIGKTSLSVNFGTNVAQTDHVLLFSLEMSAAECYSRIAQSASGISIEKMERGIETGETSRITDKLLNVSNLRFAVDDRSRSLAAIQAQTRRAVRKWKTKVVIIDYIQLVDPPDKRIPRHEQIGVMTRAFKAMAMQLDVAVISISQLSRAANGEDIAPQLHHLKESSSIEQDSDCVFLLSRKRGHIETVLDIAKNRSGPLGRVELVWRPEIFRFESASRWQGAEDYNPSG